MYMQDKFLKARGVIYTAAIAVVAMVVAWRWFLR